MISHQKREREHDLAIRYFVRTGTALLSLQKLVVYIVMSNVRSGSVHVHGIMDLRKESTTELPNAVGRNNGSANKGPPRVAND